MDYAKDKLKADLTLLEKAVQTLETGLAEPLTDIVRDAVIQRFEYSFELSWKTLQTASVYVGSECNSPREAVKQGFKMGWLKNPDDWFEALEARNRTSHTYNVQVAREVYDVAKKFPPLVREIISSISKIRE